MIFLDESSENVFHTDLLFEDVFLRRKELQVNEDVHTAADRLPSMAFKLYCNGRHMRRSKQQLSIVLCKGHVLVTNSSRDYAICVVLLYKTDV